MSANQDFMDALSLLSFAIGMANYNENLSQSDKDDMMTKMDQTIHQMLEKLEEDLEYQNQILEEQNMMLREILFRLR